MTEILTHLGPKNNLKMVNYVCAIQQMLATDVDDPPLKQALKMLLRKGLAKVVIYCE